MADICQAQIVWSVFPDPGDLPPVVTSLGTRRLLLPISLDRVADEGEQAAVLVLQPKRPMGIVQAISDRTSTGFSMNPAFTDFDLVLDDRAAGAVVDGLDKSVS